jgi:hypothetical protein
VAPAASGHGEIVAQTALDPRVHDLPQVSGNEGHHGYSVRCHEALQKARDSTAYQGRDPEVGQPAGLGTWIVAGQRLLGLAHDATRSGLNQKYLAGHVKDRCDPAVP